MFRAAELLRYSRCLCNFETMQRRIIGLLLLVMVFLSSCEKAITFDLEEGEPKLVVEATIENGAAPLVILSQSFDYYAEFSTSLLMKSFVRGAQVYVSNGIKTHQLKEYGVRLPTGDSIFYYSNDLSSPATLFLGELNTPYTLRIVSGGKEFTAATKIPFITKHIDSLYAKPAPALADSTKARLLVKATDPVPLGDYIRYFTARNSEPFYPGLNSVFDDQIIDGTTYELEVERGWDRSAERPEGFSFFDKGDTVTLKLCNIDKATYDFWRTMEFSYASIGNPFSSPTKVLGNISNGALGYFGGYAAQFKTVIIPR
jgi:Domain of unknown function (DUF4249)